MKIALVQTKPISGNLTANMAAHCQIISDAAAAGADTILFPELSLTGYEPTLANTLAIDPDDNRLLPLQTLSDSFGLIIGVGAPVKTDAGITISLLFFHPQNPIQIYSKQYLHPDEEPFFVSGKNKAVLLNDHPQIALAICYELSVPAHAENAHASGAGIYLASVAKSAQGVDGAAKRLSQIASDFYMTVGMANCLGANDGMACVGRSSAWNRQGELVGQLDDKRVGFLLFDTYTETAVEHYA